MFADHIDGLAEVLLLNLLGGASTTDMVISAGKEIMDTPDLVKAFYHSIESMDGDICVNLLVHLINEHDYHVIPILNRMFMNWLLPCAAIRERFFNSPKWMVLLIKLLEKYKADESVLNEVLLILVTMSEYTTSLVRIPHQYPFFPILLEIGRTFFREESTQLLHLICISMGSVCTADDIEALLTFHSDTRVANFIESYFYLTSLQHVLNLIETVEDTEKAHFLAVKYAQLLYEIA